jgi:PAS domain S-box-containing protein
MKDSRKTKAQLVKELQQLRRRLAKLESSRAIHDNIGVLWNENNLLLRAILEIIPDCVYVKNKTGRHLAANEAFGKSFGLDVRDIVGKKDGQILPPELAKQAINSDQEVMKSGKALRVEQLFRDEQGKTIAFDTVKAPVFDKEGKLIGLAGVSRDISEQKHSAEALGESGARLRALLNASTEPAFLTDLEGIVLALNKALAGRFHKTPAELVGTKIWELLPSTVAKSRKAQVNKVISTGKPVRFEDQRGGRHMDSVVYPVFDVKGRVQQLAVFSRDITSEKKALEALKTKEAELKARGNELKEVNKALRALLRQREKDKKELEERVLSNMKELALPYIKQLKKSGLEAKQRAFLKVLESILGEIVSPFVHELSSRYTALTPKEVQIAKLIREGKTTKEIAALMGSSRRTVESHRENIRIKLGIKHKKVNLRSYLSSM